MKDRERHCFNFQVWKQNLVVSNLKVHVINGDFTYHQDLCLQERSLLLQPVLFLCLLTKIYTMIYRYKDTAFSQKKRGRYTEVAVLLYMLITFFTIWCPGSYWHGNYLSSIEHGFIENQSSYFPLQIVDFSFHHTVSFEVQLCSP